MEVVWTQESEQDYYTQIDILLERWGQPTAEKFADQAFETIEHIVAYPQMYARTDNPEIRKAVVNQHISLYYRLEEQRITLLRFWPNRQNPGALDL